MSIYYLSGTYKGVLWAFPLLYIKLQSGKKHTYEQIGSERLK